MTSLTAPFRNLRKHWMLAAIAVFSLSIAMALGTVSLSVSNTFLLLRPAGEAAERLVMIDARRIPTQTFDSVSYLDYEYYRKKNSVFTDIAAVQKSVNVMTTSEEGRQIAVTSVPVSDNYFTVLGIHPLLGRLLAPGDDSSKDHVAVLTYACWQRLGANPNVVGKKIGGSTVIGVTPKEFTGSLFGLNGDMLTSFASDDSAWFTKRDRRQLFLLARLKPDVARSQAQAEMSTLSSQLASTYPEDKDLAAVVMRATLIPPDAVSDAEWGIFILMILILLVLLIACANVANLLLALAVGRRQEAAIKLALGAQRRTLIVDFLAEAAVICAAAALIGYGIAAVVIRRYAVLTLNFAFLGSYAIGLNLRLDWTVSLLAGALTLVAVVGAGTAPALYASSPNLAQALGGEIVVGGTRKNLRRNILVVAQVAICTLVLIGMGLCERSIYNQRHADLGFTARDLMAMQAPASLPPSPGSIEKAAQFRESVRTALAGIPGLDSIAFATGIPLFGFNHIEAALPETGKKIKVMESVADGEYFNTMGVPLLSGRVFDSSDRAKSATVAVINRSLADILWPGQDPLGKSFVAGDPSVRATVIGVVANGKYDSVSESPQPAAYYSLNQRYVDSLNLLVRTKGDPRLWIEPVRKVIRSLIADYPLAPVTFNEWMDFSLIADRIAANCVAAISVLGLLLAGLGLIGTISYSVSERKKELGIRVALGAQRGHLIGMILRRTALITGIGVAIGTALGACATVLLESEFYGVHAIELPVLIPVGLAMLVLSLIVAYAAARPWLAVDPLEAVRHS